MPRMITALIVAALLSPAAEAQDRTSPQQHLDDARRLLQTISVTPGTEAAKQIAVLQSDFADFASTYAFQTPRANAISRTEAARPAGAADWRTKYLIVEADMAGLIGPANAPAAGAGRSSIEPPVRATLQQVRTHLGTFYAATMQTRDGSPIANVGPMPGGSNVPVSPTGSAPRTPGLPQAPVTQPPPEQVPAPTPTPVTSAVPAPSAAATAPGVPAVPQPVASPPPVASADRGTALVLLDRMRALIDEALSDPPKSKSDGKAVGTSGALANSGRVTIDRAALVEMISEISQLKAMLQR